MPTEKHVAEESYPHDPSCAQSLRGIVELAARISSVRAAVVGVIEENRYVVIAGVGLDMASLPVQQSLAWHAIATGDLLAIPDTTLDPRTAGNALVGKAPFVRAWAGVPLRSRTGRAIGALEIFDPKPLAFHPVQVELLRGLGKQAMETLDLHRQLASLRGQQDEAEVAKEALRESEERLRDLFEGGNDMIMTIAADGTILHSNRVSHERLGVALDGHTTIFDLIDPHAIDDFRSVFREMIDGVESQHIETVFSGGGRPIDVDGILIPKVIGDRTALARVIFRDITARKQFEVRLGQARDAALEAARVKARFLTNISHEIRTPMNVIVGMGELLANSPLTPEQADLVRTSQASADALLGVMNNILHVSKVESGGLAVSVADLDLETIVKRTVAVMRVMAAEKWLAFDFTYDSDIPTILRGDAARLRQVLQNLIGNAVKFTVHGRVGLSVDLVRQDEQSSLIRFTIRDTGPGIPASHLSSVFEPFVQVDDSLTRAHGGLGLGLTTAKQLVDLMGGAIGVDSEPGHGSAFWFTIPFERMTDDMLAAKARRSARAGHRLLLIDPSETSRKIIRHFATSWGMRIDVFKDFESALPTYRSEASIGDPFRVVILDLASGEQKTLEIAQQLIRESPAQPVSIIGLVSLGSDIDDTRLREAGISAYLTKPVDQADLFQAMTKALAQEHLVHPEPQPEKSPAAEAPRRTVRREALKILVAEDKPLNQKLALMQLRNLGFAADAVANGAEAVEAWKKHRYDVILMDCQMPVLDGYRATMEIRRLEKDASRARIIAVTAHALEGDRQKCLAAGMDDYLSKPIKQAELDAAIARAAAI